MRLRVLAISEVGVRLRFSVTDIGVGSFVWRGQIIIDDEYAPNPIGVDQYVSTPLIRRYPATYAQVAAMMLCGTLPTKARFKEIASPSYPNFPAHTLV
ncbi:hypothetical protein Aph01nite_37540 [Acrocarpospora phusangensis]|uniref:Uncharacterized protein n=1 Tax=Acrocarpospora phusangensis TaxID=1070424 RepID=A0A919UKX3_9ACTN|nr:hypothetical protein Aph01nite_37540 [Acrocarpospora phusangensis]